MQVGRILTKTGLVAGCVLAGTHNEPDDSRVAGIVPGAEEIATRLLIDVAKRHAADALFIAF